MTTPFHVQRCRLSFSPTAELFAVVVASTPNASMQSGKNENSHFSRNDCANLPGHQECEKFNNVSCLVFPLLFRCLHSNHAATYRRQAVLAILAESCDEPQYKKLVTALCNEHQIPLIRVDSNKKLGEWSGLCKIDKEGKPRKVCGCSVVVIKVSSVLHVRVNAAIRY